MSPETTDGDVLEVWRMVGNKILTKLNATRIPGPVAVVVKMIARRIVASGESLATLRNNSPHDYGFDATSILRTIYDVMLQGLYIMADRNKREERARLYLDFMTGEQKRRIELLDASGTDLAKRFSGSQKRPSAEPEIEKQFNAVKAKFLTNKGKVRKWWYPGTLRNLAKESNLEAEYELMQRFLSGVIHSSPLALKEGAFIKGFLLMDWHWRFAFRIFGAYAEHKGITLDQDEQDLVQMSRKNVFDNK